MTAHLNTFNKPLIYLLRSPSFPSLISVLRQRNCRLKT